MGWLLVFSHFPGTGKDGEGQCWQAWGLSGTQGERAAGPPPWLPAHHRLRAIRLSHPGTFWGPPGRGCPPPRPCPPAGLSGTLRRAAACCGYHSVQFCIIKLPWLFLLETFTILCLAGKDDCSKPKLGINYTTTLHFSYKGKLCGKSCESTSFLCPPSKA